MKSLTIIMREIEEGEAPLLSYHGIRNAITMLIARILGHVNGRTFVGIERIKNPTKSCEIHRLVRREEVAKRLGFSIYNDKYKCSNKGEYLLLFNYQGIKYYGFRICKEHYAHLMNVVKETLKTRIEELFAKLINEPT